MGPQMLNRGMRGRVLENRREGRAPAGAVAENWLEDEARVDASPWHRARL